MKLALGPKNLGKVQPQNFAGYADFDELYLRNRKRWEAELLGHENIY